MERIAGAEVRSAVKSVGLEPQGLQFGEEFQRVIMAGTPEPPVTGGSSFTALLELPPNQAMELLHSAGASESQTAHFPGSTPDDTRNPYNPAQLIMDCAPAFPSDPALIERAAKYSVFAGGGLSSGVAKDSPEASPITSKSSGGVGLRVKCEPADSGSNPNSTAQVSESIAEEKVSKRKEREKKGKGSSKKNKTVRNENEDGEELPYVHVRARRGQATDSHSLAERARREKINARMKLLQELVPGCSKISGTALVLDEIINHVQSLQRQVEYLSMRLAAVNPRIDFDLDSFVAANGSLMESNFQSMVMPTLSWPEYHPTSGERAQCQQQQWQLEAPQPVWGREEDHHNLITPESSLLSYDSSANSVSLHTNQLKMEL